MHRAAGFETPTTTELVRTTLKGIRRSLGVAPQQKAPATVDVVLDMVEQVPDSLLGTRDRALLLFAFASACRRSELSAMLASDLTEVPEGFRVKIPHSKGDQEGQGQEIAVVRGKKACPVAAMKKWLEAAAIADGPVFRRMRRGGVVLDEALGWRCQRGSWVAPSLRAELPAWRKLHQKHSDRFLDYQVLVFLRPIRLKEGICDGLIEIPAARGGHKTYA